MSSDLKKRIEDRQKDLNHIELLIAAGKGDVANIKRLMEENADVNFIDTGGNTVLHYAVESRSLQAVQILLGKVKDPDIENNANETPLDIASRLPNKTITETLGQEVINKSFRLLEEAASNAETSPTQAALTHTNPAPTQAEQQIKNTVDKIKYCLEAIDKLKTLKSDEEDLSYEQANVFIYFLEAFALEGSGDEEVKNKVKQHFSPCYSDQDRNIISDARKLLLKKSDKKIRLQDVRKFIRGDVSSFFHKLKEYVESVHNKLSSRTNNNKIEIELSSFLNVLEKKERNIGERIDDTRTFLRIEFEKIIAAAYEKQQITPEKLFSFTMNFYPAFQRETNSDFKELRDMRNKLIHEFHKYGYVEFRNAIYSLRSRLFKYYYAQEVLKIFNSIKPDENPETIRRNFEKHLLSFKKQFKSGYGTEQMISQEDVKGSLGYVFSHSVFPERDDSCVEELVDQYLKFMTIIDCEKKEEYDLFATSMGTQEPLDDTNLNDDGDKPVFLHKELNDVERRQIFEKFGRLKRIKSYCSKGFEEEKHRLRDELTKTYGVNGYHFDKVCSAYVENDHEFSQQDKIKVQEIAKTINNLKKLKDNYKLSNQIIISLYADTSRKQEFSVFEENQSLLKDIDAKTQQEIKNEFPRDKILEISTGNETFCFHLSKIVSNMLKTFYDAYHKYQVEFNVEEIFNDEIFLDYLVRTEVKEKDIADAVNSDFKLLVFICSEMETRNRETEFFDYMDIRKVFEVFKTLRKCKEHFSEKDYNNEKETLKKNIVDKTRFLLDFDKACELLIENDNSLHNKEIKEVEKIKQITSNLKSLGFSWQIITALYDKLINGKGSLSLEKDLGLLRNSDKSQKVKVKEQLEKLYMNDLGESKINMIFGNETISVSTCNVVATAIKIFKEQQQFKRPFFVYMVIRKLLKIHHCAPYIVKLITEVKSDDVIEKDDLLKLIDILLKKEDGLYIKYLLELLRIGSGKLNLYEEICNKIIENNSHIPKMRIILKEPDHISKILNILKANIEAPYNVENTHFVQMVKEILKLLNNIAFEMCRNLNYDVALKILCETNAVHEKLIHSNLIEKNDLNALETKCQIGRIKNRLGMQEPEKSCVKTVLHKEALTVFREIHETMKFNEMFRDEREIKVHEMPLFLLILSEIAYTKHLLKKYKESWVEQENLCQEVVKYVLDLPRKYCLPNNFLNSQKYSEIDKTKNYQELLTVSEESKKYLDVLNIKSSVAYNKSNEGQVKFSEENYSEAEEYYNQALSTYKDIYAIRKQNLGLVYRAIIPGMCDISFNYSRISALRLKSRHPLEDPRNTLEFYYLGLQKENMVYESQRDMFWPNHSAALKSREKIVLRLRGIGYACEEFAKNMSKNEEKKTWYKKSLGIFENLYDIMIQLYGEKHTLTNKVRYSRDRVRKSGRRSNQTDKRNSKVEQLCKK